jgi:hypothetical protein
MPMTGAKGRARGDLPNAAVIGMLTRLQVGFIVAISRLGSTWRYSDY